MIVKIVSHSDQYGGAARAAYRLHRALREKNVQSEMVVKVKTSDDRYVTTGRCSKFRQLFDRGIGFVSTRFQVIQKTKNSILHSFNQVGSFVFSYINTANADVVNLHWINSETLSIKQVSKINKPIVMTMHDMWAICGSEHLSIDSQYSQFRCGYNIETKDSDFISGINLNRLVWRQKKKYWVNPFSIVTPSRWLSACVRESDIFSGWDVYTIPNALDVNVFKPVSKAFARASLNLPLDDMIIGFGAIGGCRDFNKGFDLLEQAINSDLCHKDYKCLVIGQSEPEVPSSITRSIRYLGHINDDTTLMLFYNAVDVVVVPSRQESFGQSASEALACGTPVVAFNTSGLRDVVDHQLTGYLAKPFDVSDLANGINWAMQYKDSLSASCRNKAIRSWSYDVVAEQYIMLYKKIQNK